MEKLRILRPFLIFKVHSGYIVAQYPLKLKMAFIAIRAYQYFGFFCCTFLWNKHSY